MTSNSTANTAENKHNGETALLLPDGRLLAVPGENNTMVVIDAARGEGAVGNLLRPPGRPGVCLGPSRPWRGCKMVLLSLRATLTGRSTSGTREPGSISVRSPSHRKAVRCWRWPCRTMDVLPH